MYTNDNVCIYVCVYMYITGTRASAVHVQLYLVEGLVRWNSDRAQDALQRQVVTPLCSYDVHMKKSLNILSEDVLGYEQISEFRPPGKYTGMFPNVTLICQRYY
jgi:hypothetical protein